MPLLLFPLLLIALPPLATLARGLPHLGSLVGDLDVLGLSLALAAAATLLTLALEGGVEGPEEALLLLPYLIPPFVVGMGVLFSFQGLGLKATGIPGILLAWVLHYTPLAYALLRPQAGAVHRFLLVARVHGVRGLGTLWVLLPPIYPSLLVTGGTLYLAFLGNFGIPAVLGLPERVYLLSTLAYARLLSPLSPDPLGQAAAVGLLLGLAALPALWLAQPPGTEPQLPLPAPRRPWARWAFTLYGALALAASTAGLLREALLDPYTGRWAPAFAGLLALPLARQGLMTSLALALTATLALLLLAALLRPWPALLRSWRRVLDLSYLLPGTLLALGLILLLGGTPLYGTPFLLLLAYLLNFTALALRALEASARVEGAVLAARVHGVGPLRAWLRVGYPLALPHLAAGAFLVFPLTFSEITLSAILYAPGSETVGVVALSLLQGGLYREAAALGLILGGLSVLALLGRRAW